MKDIVILNDFGYCVWILDFNENRVWNSVSRFETEIQFAEELMNHPKKILIKYED